VAIPGALKGPLGRPSEGTRDHAADFQITGIKDRAGGFAEVIKSIEAEGFLVAGDLENAVGGCVKNRQPSANVLSPEPVQNLGAGGVAVAEGAFDA
jgi:hypothetical protein